jgi:hypothetical protein
MITLRRETRKSALLLAVIAVVGIGWPLAAQKGGGKAVPQDWPCQLTLRDAVDVAGNPVDSIVSDGWGSYVNGQDGNRVRCTIVNAPGTSVDGWLLMFIDADSTRYMTFPAKQAQNAYTRSGYSTFQNRGSFDVNMIRTADVIGQSYLRPYRAYVESSQFGRIRLFGDSFAVAPPDRFTPDLRGTSSVFVARIDACTWQVTADPISPITAGEGAQSPRILALIEAVKNTPLRSADFSMAFSATVRIIGVKPGCGAP